MIAPSLIPRRAGDRVKTDRRDCIRLAELARAGELRAVWIPDPADEAIRDLARAREDAVNARTQARHQLKSFLLRHELRYPHRTSWSKTFYRWLSTLSFTGGAQTAFTEYWQAVTAGDERVERLSSALRSSIAGWRFEPVVAALQALRGIDVTSAIGLVAEIGDIARFAHPRQLMSYLGLVPSGAIERRAGGAWQYHQGRQRARPPAAHRGGVELSIQTAYWLCRAAAGGAVAAGDSRTGLEGATAAQADSLCETQGARACTTIKFVWRSHASSPALCGRWLIDTAAWPRLKTSWRHQDRSIR